MICHHPLPFLWPWAGCNAAPLRICTLGLELCSGTLSRQLACALARKPELDGGNSCLCAFLVSVSQAGIYDL